MIQSTKKYIFDTDWLSTFITFKLEEYLFKIFDKIIIPIQVKDEFDQYMENNLDLKNRFDSLVKYKKIIIHDFEKGSEEWSLFFDMAYFKGDKKIKRIGHGEAACIAFAKVHRGVICSNNLSDIMYYVNKFNLEYLTTADIFCYLNEKKIMNYLDIEHCWQKITTRSKLPTTSFLEYYTSKKTKTHD